MTRRIDMSYDLQNFRSSLTTIPERLQAKELRLVIGLIILSTCVVLLTRWAAYRRRESALPSTPVIEKGTFTRSPGVWHPSPFQSPLSPPYPDWNINTTKALPYRPFRYGPKYVQTMGLRTVDHRDWIELDNQFPRYYAQKLARIASRGEKCCKTAPEAYPAALELLEELVDYLPARYPSLYRRLPQGIENLHTHETVLLNPAEDPIQACARLIQDDLAIMIERPDGEYYLLSGAILLPGFWRLEDKFGMNLSRIHTSGDVPDFERRLEKGMKNLFRRMQPEKMVARNNYFFQLDDDLAWSWSIGPEDEKGIGWFTAQEGQSVEQIYFRSERQTLRRLPKTGGIVFTIRTYFLPIVDIAREKGVSGRLASAVRSWGDDVSKYKGAHKYKDVLLEYLDASHQADIQQYGKEEMDKVQEEWSAYPY